MNGRDRKFVDEFFSVDDGNAKQAAIRAGYSASTARRASSWLKHNGPKPDVAHEIQERLIANANVWRMRDERTKSVLFEMLTADPNEMFNDDGTIRPIAEWPRGLRYSITSFEHITEVEEGKDGKPSSVMIARPKIVKRTEVAKLVGETQGLFKQVVEHEYDDDLMAALQRGRERAAIRNADYSDDSSK